MGNFSQRISDGEVKSGEFLNCVSASSLAHATLIQLISVPICF